MTVRRAVIFGGMFIFMGVVEILLSVVWGGSGADVVIGVLWLVVGAMWFASALAQRRRERPGASTD
jgi:uncharacterized membrane protein HdeD (DUF308 family)